MATQWPSWPLLDGPHSPALPVIVNRPFVPGEVWLPSEALMKLSPGMTIAPPSEELIVRVLYLSIEPQSNSIPVTPDAKV